MGVRIQLRHTSTPLHLKDRVLQPGEVVELPEEEFYGIPGRARVKLFNVLDYGSTDTRRDQV